MSKTAFQWLAQQTGLFVYVDCGARGDVSNPLVEALPTAKYIGFEPDDTECARLSQQANEKYTYFPIALGKDSETRTLYLTSNPACASLFCPDHAFWGRFLDCAPQIEVKGIQKVRTVTLDAYLPSVGIHQIDFLELDTQGSELDILHGAETFLSTSVLGIRVEVEFSAMYQDQPLFADVDSYVRQFGFMLFDLSRHRYRRQNYPRDKETRGQLLYGHAFYLKDYHCLAGQDQKKTAAKLATAATFYGFYDYALEVVDFLLQGNAGSLDPEETKDLTEARAGYLSPQSSGRLIKAMLWLQQSRLNWLFHKLGMVSTKILDAYTLITKRRSFSWSD